MNDNSPLRLAMLGVLLVGLFLSLFARLWYLQVTDLSEDAQAEAEANLFRTIYVSAPRGRVLDRAGNVLIDNRLVNEVVIDVFELRERLPGVEEQEAFTISLAREISSAGRLIKAADINAALNDTKFGRFDKIPIATDVSERFSILLGEREDEFPGVELQKTTVRFYPYGGLAAHLLGFVGPVFAEDLALLEGSPKLYQPNDEIGRSGIEASLEDVLRGTPGVEVIEVDAAGNRIDTISASLPEPGNDVTLTLDINLQALVERELARGIREARTRVETEIDSNGEAQDVANFKAPGGAMVLVDPDGSRILAMASYPTYDQSVYLLDPGTPERESELTALNNDPDTALLNRATNSSYSPGSTFKLITAYAALDTGLLGDRGFLGRTRFLEDKGFWRIPGCDFGAGCVIANAGDGKPLGDVDLTAAITKSSNVFFGQLGYQFDVRQGFQAAQLLSIARDFGYGEQPDFIPGTLAGDLPPPATAGDAANLAVGQGGMIATPVQMANSYAAIANGGSVYAPMIAENALDAATGEVIIDYEPRLVHELYMPDEYSRPLLEGLKGVVLEGGTAADAFENFPLNRFEVLGKTGTVENRPKQDNAAFAAFGPWPNPQYAAVTYIEQSGNGGDSAAPVVARVFRRIADDDIEIVPTVAEADELISESEALEEERLRTEREAERDAELAAQTADEDGPGFAILVPDQPEAIVDESDGETDGEAPETDEAGAP